MFTAKARSASPALLPLLFTSFFAATGDITSLWAQESRTNTLANMTLEQLMSVEVTSVSKHSEPISHAPAAIYVLSNDDIRRSGATSIPEALRLVPGLQVAQINPGNWAISSRGFNGRFANKLLVMIDGRSVYTPLFSGVYWDVQDTLLADIERIEVIRGPGASLWGANAVNGVINIITKDSAQTTGGMLTAGGGTEERAFGRARYGGHISEDATYRAYMKYTMRDEGPAGNNSTEILQGGYRVDWRPYEGNKLTIQGDVYAGDSTSGTISQVSRVAGGNAIVRWEREFTASSIGTLQAYYDRTERTFDVLTEYRNTFNIDWQHQFDLGERNQVVWGAGYRLTTDQTFGTPTVTFNPHDATDHLASVFLQDEFAILPEKLWFTVGSKLEHNQYTGFEVQPNVRLSWRPTEKQTVWASWSRAMRSPSRAETDLFATSGTLPGPTTTIMGNPNFVSEELEAYELGYRIQPHRSLTLDVAAFYNAYDHLRSLTLLAPPPNVVLQANNSMNGYTYGGEFSAVWQPVSWWRLHGSYTLLQMHLNSNFPGADSTFNYRESDNPQHQFQFRSSFDLPHGFEFDAMVQHVDSLPGQNVPAYTRLDTRIGWRSSKNVDVSVVFQNLLDNRHFEYGRNFLVFPDEVQRSVYAKVTWNF